MERAVEPSFIKGQVKAPPSKSMTQRAIAAAMLADGESSIKNPSYCDDCLAAMSIAVGLGAKVEPGIYEMKITGCRGLREKKLNCGESGLAIRMFSPIAALYPEEITISGAGSLKNRPMSMINEALEQFGVNCSTTGGFLPLTIKGPLKGGNCEIDGSMSSQLLTGLLMALPAATRNSVVKVMDLKSKPYIDMTISILKDFGIEITNENYKVFKIRGKQKFIAGEYEVEGDWSGGAFLLVAGAIRGNIEVLGLKPDSKQSDRAILEALKMAGAEINMHDSKISISKSSLKSFDFDAKESPDLFPPLVALAAYCSGISRIKGTSRLVYKESNRASVLSEEFGKLNIRVEEKDDSLLVTGGEVAGSRVASHDDHRIAMAEAVAALGAKGIVYIKDSHCIAKSYPDFFNDLGRLGAKINE
jgi:3-phosphoshikimate 1-carboxyvinyltransferase